MKSVFTIIYIIWAFSEIFINRFMRSKSGDKKNQDKNSLAFIWITIVFCMTVAIYISSNYYLPISTFQTIRYFGIGLILTGVILRGVVISSLGKYFTADVTIRQGHQLKKDGFYKYLRHPSYSASLLSFIGFGISLNNWISLIIIVAAVLFAFTRRINVEEKTLTEHFGEEYIDYKKRTTRLIPFIY
jgi:protein-S-isoprenylcysteine O-methyltransferase Ste14